MKTRTRKIIGLALTTVLSLGFPAYGAWTCFPETGTDRIATPGANPLLLTAGCNSRAFVTQFDAASGRMQLDAPPGFVDATVLDYSSLMIDLSAGEAGDISPADVVLQGITISRQNVRPGEIVTITAKLTNPENLAGEYILKIAVSGLLDTTRQVRVGPGRTEEVRIDVTPVLPGDYTVEINGLTGTFRVDTPAVSPRHFLYWVYLSVAIAIVTGVAFYIVLVLKARQP